MVDDHKILRLIEDTSEVLDLPNFVVEKDYYVTQVIQSLSHIENEFFRLIFCGGTCLAKAHKLVNRMSEDVDFKIQLKINEKLSRSRLIKELKEFRSQIVSSLLQPTFSIVEDVARNEGKYSRLILNYPYSFPVKNVLRPNIMLEFTLSEIRLPTEYFSVKTLIENTLENIVLFTSPNTQCISAEETAIEKWVGLTRRIIAIERKYHQDDPTLVRHIYDLSSITAANKITENFFNFAKSVINNDVTQFTNQHPEYSSDPFSEIKNSLRLLRNKDLWKERYYEFIETMVYNNATLPEYEKAIDILEQISARIDDVF